MPSIPPCIGAGYCHKLLQYHGSDVVEIVDAYRSKTKAIGFKQHSLLQVHRPEEMKEVDGYKSKSVPIGFESVTIDRAWRNISLTFLEDLVKKKFACSVFVQKAIKKGGQSGKAFMQVYLYHKLSKDLWLQDTPIILKSVLSDLIQPENIIFTSNPIQAAVLHLHLWHKSNRLTPTYTTLPILSQNTNGFQRDWSSRVDSISCDRDHNRAPTRDSGSSTTSEISSLHDLFGLLQATNVSDSNGSGYLVYLQHLGISSFVHIVQAHKNDMNSPPMPNRKTQNDRDFWSLLHKVSNFIQDVLMAETPTRVRYCFDSFIYDVNLYLD